ncbi:hypothetical protein [Phytoactinopolyspora mesophila]|uniref:Uncharacterized protein n=1 Tax=Phytoactinopolyspora mesophila TaxID=2650750 RepID=A0A7K3MCN4_9ACTN|nr:hypothetical protein [Phytoactinopolyspora mesophila]NDL61053.1 hypothetical protein [Phytoactinopolyspora mesophila]
MTSQERKDLDNGIWLCKIHADLVDTNHSRYTVGLLKAWRARAEELARLRQDGVTRPGRSRFFAHEQTIGTPDDETEAKARIGALTREFLADVGVSQVLTRTDCVVAENVIFELLLNAHRYEGVRTFRIVSSSASVSVEYTSLTGYGLESLMEETRGHGGVDAVKMLADETQGRVQLNFRFSEQTSHWICSAVQLGYSDDPCAINLRDSDEHEREIFTSDCAGCESVHVHGHLNDHTSDNWVTARYVKQLIDQGVQVVVHSVPGPMARHLRTTIQAVLDGSEGFEMSEHA